MPIDQQWVRNILRNDGCLVHVDIVDVVNQIDAPALAIVSRLDDPDVLLALVLLELLVVIIKIAELFGKDVSVRGQVKSRLTELLLHTHYVVAHAVFAGNLVR